MKRNTFYLQERRTSECRLAAADVEFLLAEHRAHVRLAPTGRADRYRLTATGHVGTIVGPGCRLVIRPKTPVENLFYLLDPGGDLPVQADGVAVTGAEALDFLAGRLARLLRARAAAGLHRGYAERNAAGPYLQGRLDVAAHLREAAAVRDRFPCHFEELTADVLCNQVPKATAERVLRSPLLGGGARAALGGALAAFDGVSPVGLGAESFARAGPDRLTEDYRPLLDLCRLLADGLGPGEQTGPAPCPAFLLNLEQAFEQYVTRAVIDRLPAGGRFTAAAQPLLCANRPAAGQSALPIRPDLTLDRDGCPVLVLDAKWKRGRGGLPLTADLYQVLAYATALGAARAVLVYPARRDRAWTYAFPRGGIRVEVRTVRVVGPVAACARSRDHFGNAVVRSARRSRRRDDGGRA